MFLIYLVLLYTRLFKHKIPRIKRRIRTFFNQTKAFLARNSFKGRKKTEEFFDNLTSMINSHGKVNESYQMPRNDRLAFVLRSQLLKEKEKKKLWKKRYLLMCEALRQIQQNEPPLPQLESRPFVNDDPTNMKDFKPFEHTDEDQLCLEINLNNLLTSESKPSGLNELKIFKSQEKNNSEGSPTNLMTETLKKSENDEIMNLVSEKMTPTLTQSCRRVLLYREEALGLEVYMMNSGLEGNNFSNYYHSFDLVLVSSQLSADLIISGIRVFASKSSRSKKKKSFSTFFFQLLFRKD